MAGTNAVKVKQALVALLQAAPELEGIQVDYAFPGEIERDCIYLGRVTFSQEFMAFKGATRMPRKEQANVSLYVRSYAPGVKSEGAEERAAELGEVVEHILAADPRLESSPVPGLKVARVTGGELLSAEEDEGTGIAILTYRISVTSQLT